MNKNNIRDIYRLTSLQQGMLFHSLSAPGSGVYVEQVACPAPGLIDHKLWQQAWSLLLAGYPILHSAIAWEGLEHPQQVVMRKAQLEVVEIDAAADDDAVFTARLEALRRADAARGFDLRTAPLLRQTLLHRRDASVVFWTYHHILLDGWSAFILLGEALSAYMALSEGRTWQPRPAAHYRDYLRWLKERDVAGAESYWRERLSGFHAATPLGLVECDSVTPDASGATVTKQLGVALALQLRNCARTLRVTVGTLAQAAWAYTLSIYSGDNDVVFGATVAGRPADLEGAEGMVGLFINTVPVRVRINPAEPARDFVARLQTELLAQRMHEHAALTEIAGWSVVPRGRPLFDSMLAIESFPYTQSVSLSDVTVWQKTNFPLALVIEPVGNMRVKALFDAGRHAPDTIARLLDHYRWVLEQLVTQLDAPLGKIGLCPPFDTAIQTTWNNRPAVGEAGIDLGELFTRQVAATPDAAAVVTGDVRMSYSQLDDATRVLATRLRVAGVISGDTVAIALEPSPDMIVALIAITRLGCAYAPLDERLPPVRLAEMVSDLKIRHIVGEDTHVGLFDLPGVTMLLPRGSVKASDLIDGLNTPWPRAQPGRLLYVIHTSGSTGKPKAAGVFHASFVRLIQWWNSEFGFNADDRCLLTNKITFDLAQKCVWSTLTTGGALHLIPTQNFDPLLVRERVATQSITWINCTPSMAYVLVESDSDIGTLASVRMLFVGGEPVDKRRLAPWLLADGCHTKLINTYGPTECTDLCTMHRFTRAEFEQPSQPVTVGQVLPGLAVQVLDRFGNCLPLGVTGEVVIAGGSVGAGYLNNVRMSAEKFLPDPGAGVPGARLYLTGDLGYFRADGTLIIRGRTDFQVKLRGYRIELNAIGNELCGHAQVRDAVAVVAPDGQQLVAYVVPTEGVTWSDALRTACRAHLATRLPEYMVPALFVALERLPLNVNGKLDRAALPAVDMSTMVRDKIAPCNPVETELFEIWSGVLGHSDFGVTNNFFELGGHSLTSTQLLARVRTRLNRTITLPAFLAEPTVRAMAYRIENEAEAIDEDDNEAMLDGVAESMLALPDRLPRLASGLEQVLLTGATGFLGAYLVAEILQRWSRVVLHCHVRARDEASGLQRLRDNLAYYGLWCDEYLPRIRIVIADLAVPGLDLRDDAYTALTRDIDLVIHNGSNVNHVLPYRALRKDNVESTRNLLQLAVTSKLKGFVYVSTVGVLHGDNKSRTVDETRAIELEQQTPREGYNASKWVAELMVRRASAAGAPAQIVRVGRAVIESQSGAGRLDDFVALFLRTCLRIGAYPDFPLVEQIVPVDYLARAVTALAANYSGTGVFHLIGDNKRNWSKLLPDFVDCADAGLKLVPLKDWADTVKSRSAIEPLPFAPYLFLWDTDAGAPEEKRLNIRQSYTTRLLDALDVCEPQVEDAAWQRYLGDIFAAEGRVMKPRKRSIFLTTLTG